MKKKFKHTIVIGNGFDLNLGLNTSYKAFFLFLESQSFFQEHKENKLISFIYDKGKKDNWYDFEGILQEYALTETDSHLLRLSAEFRKVLEKIDVGDKSAINYVEQYKDLSTISTSIISLLDKLSKQTFLDLDFLASTKQIRHTILSDLDEFSNTCREQTKKTIELLREKLRDFLGFPRIKDQEMSESLMLICSACGAYGIGVKAMADAWSQRFSNEYSFRELNEMRIVSFNYTDAIYMVSDMLKWKSNRRIGFESDSKDMPDSFYHIHGTLESSMIFGISDNQNIPNEYWCMKKKKMLEENAISKFHKILNESERIIIFGHSIYGVDFDYYKEFLRKEQPNTEIFIVAYKQEILDEIQKQLDMKGVIATIKYRIADTSEERFKNLCQELSQSLDSPMGEYIDAVNNA